MTPEAFRRLALSMPDAVEGEHMNHPDFRANGRIFATLHPNGTTGMVKVSPVQQRALVAAHPDAFVPGSGAWGRQGCTMVQLASVDAAALRDAMTDAWQVVMALPAGKTKAARVAKAAKTAKKPSSPRPRRG
jgi:hypothetical protein